MTLLRILLKVLAVQKGDLLKKDKHAYTLQLTPFLDIKHLLRFLGHRSLSLSVFPLICRPHLVHSIFGGALTVFTVSMELNNQMQRLTLITF